MSSCADGVVTRVVAQNGCELPRRSVDAIVFALAEVGRGGLVGIAFDTSGTLLVATGGALLAYRESQIAQSGSPTPDATYANTTSNPGTTVIGGS